jgi:tRNA-splicing ligase RtcB
MRVPVKIWDGGGNVPFEDAVIGQISNAATLPIIHNHVALMPDGHFGIGAAVGSVIPTVNAIIPAAVGVDIGCGMAAVQTSLNASQLPDSLAALRSAIEQAVPHGRSDNGGSNDVGSFRGNSLPATHAKAWADELAVGYARIASKYPKLGSGNSANHLGTLGTGNHFTELCLDESGQVWVMLHSGSRGVGNRFGMHFIALAKEDMIKAGLTAVDKDLSYLTEGTQHFNDYVEAVDWAQKYARINRQLMMGEVIRVMRDFLPPFTLTEMAVNCHHNYVAREHHFGQDVWLTRKGAVSAAQGQLGIIPGSMGAKSFIVRGKGNPESFHSCSHGAGRSMSRGEAKRRFSLEDHEKATVGVECRKDVGVIDETPAAYKSIDNVMAAQTDLVEIVYTLKQVLCVKG